MAGNKTRTAFQTLLNRITGFSTPIVGLQWTAAPVDRNVIKSFLTFLEDRRVLYVPYILEIPDQVSRSVQEIRGEATRVLQNLTDLAEGRDNVRAIRTACRKFLTSDNLDFHFFHDHPTRPHRQAVDPGFFVCLGELRATIGAHVAKLAVIYELDIEPELLSIMPAADADEA
ncbi:MAG: hypothetical protein P4L72_02630 [Parvibaculum sp.]|uniref:DUF6650 family protein n=1 Tax=Parvibaculum sp. TaxID=2024848 RepID=UPI002849C6ED|nr:DUF6650 family protein [Parvibaculum sp.]MDR3498105.1 hypothetical protein [Parvibaculum sp.]